MCNYTEIVKRINGQPLLLGLIQRQVILPMTTIPRIVAVACAIQPKKPGRANRTQFTIRDTEAILQEILLSHFSFAETLNK